ncbi:MAG: YcxB family protein [Thermoplasmatota archaeon]
MIGYCIYNAQKYAILSRFIRNTIKRIAKKNDYSRELGPNEITIGPDGLHRKNRYSEDKTSWEGIIRIVQTKNHIFFFVTDVAGYILPKRAFKTQKEKEDFIRKANEFWRRSR